MPCVRSLLPSAPAWLRGQIYTGKEMTKSPSTQKTGPPPQTARHPPLSIHPIQLTPMWSVCACSFLLSHPVLFFSLFLSSYNRWFLSYFSCILKSWVPRCILNISSSHSWVFLNFFSCLSMPDGYTNTPQPSGWLGHWLSWMHSGKECGRREREATAGKKAYRCVCSYAGQGNAYRQSSFSVFSSSLLLDFVYNIRSRIFHYNFVQRTSICK